MSIKVVILASAEQDLLELRDYLVKNFSTKTWRESLSKIKETIHHLQQHPLAGLIPEEIEKLNITQYRQMLSGKNRLIYELRQETIYIHMIVDDRRDMQSLLARRLIRAK